MAIRFLDSAPSAADFTPLQEHQEQTPTTFFGAKPVLYAHYAGLTLSAQADQLQQDAAIANFNAQRDGDNDDALVKDVDIWVTSENLILFQTAPTPAGIAIPYPTIALHATMKWKSQVDALYMSLSLNDAETVNEEEDIQTLEMTLLPPNYASSPETACIKDIYGAMNICADLHPDADSDDDGEDILDGSAPGATGWITAENMGDFTDADGNFTGTVIGGEDLGPGAGTVRPHEDGEDDANGVNRHEEKYFRTD